MTEQEITKKNIFFRVGDFFNYLLNKRSELPDLDFKDALLAQANVRIYRTRTHKSIERVLLNKLQYLHRLDRENALDALNKRVKVIRENQNQILKGNQVSMAALAEYLPSVSSIKVVKDKKGDYLAFEGNGRIAALKEVFDDSGDILVEVEQYHFKDDNGVLKLLHRLRHLNGLA